MVVYVLYRSYLDQHMPETEILGVYSTEEACKSAQHVYIADNWEYVNTDDVCYHETVLDM